MSNGYEEIIVFLRGGTNNAVSPSTIEKDQLVESVGMEYRPPRLGLFPVKGRSRLDPGLSSAGGKTFGLVYCGFDGAPNPGYLVAFQGASAYGASGVAGQGTFTQIGYGTPAQRVCATGYIDGIHYGNDWYFYGAGVNNLRLREEAMANGASGALFNFVQHGLFAETASGYAVATAGAGGSQMAAGDYEVWWTWRGSLSNEETNDSAYDGTVSKLNLSASGMGIRFYPPAGFPAAATGYANRVGNGSIYTYLYAGRAGQKFPFGFKQLTGRSAAFTASGSYVKVTAIEEDTPYPIIAPLGGVPVSSHGPPPLAYTMRVFHDCLVCIDAEDRQLIKYSLPDDPLWWPSSYFIPVETGWQDKFNALEVVNDRLLAFSNFNGFRFNRLALHTDPEDLFANRGKLKEKFLEGHGCCGPRATCVFSIVDGVDLCMFVCRCGIHITNGEITDYATPALDWKATVDVSQLWRSVLKNNPGRFRVEFYFIDANGDPKRIDFYYYKLLAQEGSPFPRLPWLGPHDVPGLAAALGVLNDDWRMYTGHESTGAVYTEGTGTSDAANIVDASGTINHSWKTKDFYFGGIHSDFELDRFYTHQGEITASGSYALTGKFRYDDSGSHSATGLVDQSAKNAQPHPFSGRGQNVSIRAAKNDTGDMQELNYIIFVVRNRTELATPKAVS